MGSTDASGSAEYSGMADSAAPADPPVNVAAQLSGTANARPNDAAVILPRIRGERDDQIDATTFTFADLDQRSGWVARGLQSIGIGRGVRTVLMVPPSPDFFELTFALFKVGAVPVMIDPGMGIKNLGRCLGEADPQAFIGIPKAHLARRILGWARKSITITVTTGSRWAGGRYTVDRLRRIGESAGPLPCVDSAPSETAAILFTSGSTGVAKGVVYTHAIFAAQVRMLRTIYGIQPGEIDLSTFPLFALFGPALGMTAVIPEMDPTKPAEVDPRKIITAVRRFQVTNLFGSPALINRVGRWTAEHGESLPTIRRVISAGAPVPAAVIERFTRALPESARLYTPYGATESLPVANIDHRTILSETRFATAQGKGVCVGSPVPGMEVRIIGIDDGPIERFDPVRDALPCGRVGEIAVCGPVVTESYYGRPSATASAKMRDDTGRIWHRMGDLGYRDESGRIWFCGRKSHRVRTASGEMYTIPCEGIFNTHPAVFRSALVGVGPVGNQVPVMCIEREPPKPTTPMIAWNTLELALRSLADQFEHTRPIRRFLLHAGFPVDIRHNAKIFREKLADWAAQRVRL